MRMCNSDCRFFKLIRNNVGNCECFYRLVLFNKECIDAPQADEKEKVLMEVECDG